MPRSSTSLYMHLGRFWGGSNILHCCLSQVADRGEGIHTWAASVLETEVVGDSHFNYKESRKQMVFWDTILCSGHCVDFKDYLPPKKKQIRSTQQTKLIGPMSKRYLPNVHAVGAYRSNVRPISIFFLMFLVQTKIQMMCLV